MWGIKGFGAFAYDCSAFYFKFGTSVCLRLLLIGENRVMPKKIFAVYGILRITHVFPYFL